MTGIQDDLATLRSHAAETDRDVVRERIEAIDRVEDEIARLEAENKQLRTHGLPYTLRKAWARAEAAEAERDNWKASCARYLAARQAAEAEVQRLKKIVGEA